MSRTRHHSSKWNGRNKFSSDELQKKEGVYRSIYNGTRKASESRHSWDHVKVIVPMRLADRLMIRKFLKGEVDPDGTVMPYLGSRGQHEWDW